MATMEKRLTCVSQEFNQTYQFPVYFIHNLFDSKNEVLKEVLGDRPFKENKKIIVFIDDNLAKKNPLLTGQVKKKFANGKLGIDLIGEPFVFPGGERVKNTWDYVHKVTGLLNQFSFDRHDFVLVLGGGALLDMVGFAASIYHRGIKLIRVPTTTLAQNDAGIGVKNGINCFEQKNSIGTFTPPFAVINDFSFLKTLPFSHYISGVAEAFKIAMIKDASLFSFLVDHSDILSQRNQETIVSVIYQCACLHLDHIAHGGDPYESGSSRPLDYGHWSAHKIEMMSQNAISHGYAVSIGIALDSYYAWKMSLITESDLYQLLTSLIKCRLPIWSNYLSRTNDQDQLELENGLEDFRIHLGGRLTFTMPDGIGKTCQLHEMDFEIVRNGIQYLEDFSEEMSAYPIDDSTAL
ncbi:MAG: 3-dehydroquinate synthase [Deltaproteobacteria bacterium]|nr:3-dehydroquinate synthase [Deltaproteobacteria bacterium]